MTMRVVPLADLCEMDRRTIQPDDPAAETHTYLGVENVVSGHGELDLSSSSRVGDGRSIAFRFDQRHVLYAKLRPYLNKVATPDFEGRCSTELVPLLPRRGVDRGFLAHLLRRQATVDFVMASVTGARMPRTDMSVLLSMPVPLPPLDEQRRIVDILNRAESVRRLRDRANAALRALVPALFVRMFGDPVENPMGWEVRPLGELVAGFEGGKNVEAGSGASPYQILKVSAVTSGRFDPTKARPAPDNHIPAKNHAIRQGDILFSRANTATLVGATVLVEGHFPTFLLPDKLWRILFHERSPVEPLYLLHSLKDESVRREIGKLASGTSASMLNISQAKLKQLPIPVPPMAAQRRFAHLVGAASGLTASTETAAATASSLSAALTSRLFGEAA